MHQHRVLIVEDNALIIRIAQLALSKRDVSVDVATNGEQAIMATRLRDYTVIFMDLQMPVMGGVEATKRIRAEQSRASRRVPIVGITAGGDQGLALEAGMDECLIKPIDYAAVFDRWAEPQSAQSL